MKNKVRLGQRPSVWSLLGSADFPSTDDRGPPIPLLAGGGGVPLINGPLLPPDEVFPDFDWAASVDFPYDEPAFPDAQFQPFQIP